MANKNNKYKKYKKINKFGESKRVMLRRVEQRQMEHIDNMDVAEENYAIIKYANSKGVDMSDVALELNRDMSKVTKELSFQMSPQKIKNYCDAIDRVSLKKSTVV